MTSDQPTMRLATTKVLAKGPMPILGATLLKSALGTSSVRQCLLKPVTDWLAELRMNQQVRTACGATEASSDDNVTEQTDHNRPNLHEPARDIDRATYAGRPKEQRAGKQHHRHDFHDAPTIPLKQQWRLLFRHSLEVAQ